MALAAFSAIGGSIAWYAFGSLTSTTPDHAAEQAAAGHTRSSRLSQKQAADDQWRQQMLDMETKWRARYDGKKQEVHPNGLPDKEDAYRAWRDRKEQAEHDYAQFQHDPATAPNSVKVQLKQSIENMDLDRPRR